MRKRGSGWIIGSVPVTETGARLRDQNTLDIVIYEQDYLTRALLQQWLSEAGYRVRVGMARDCGLDFQEVTVPRAYGLPLPPIAP